MTPYRPLPLLLLALFVGAWTGPRMAAPAALPATTGLDVYAHALRAVPPPLPAVQRLSAPTEAPPTGFAMASGPAGGGGRPAHHTLLEGMRLATARPFARRLYSVYRSYRR